MKDGKKFWEERCEDINASERHLVRNGTLFLKFFLNGSTDEQKRRFLERLDRPEKIWKFPPSDLAERGYWDDYMAACIRGRPSVLVAPRGPLVCNPGGSQVGHPGVVADVDTTSIRAPDLIYPGVTPEQRKLLAAARKKLEAE